MATDPRVKNMITDQLVTYEVAKLAKEKGFDGECRDFYCNDKLQKRISVTSCNRQVTSFDYCSNTMLEDYDSPKEYYHYAAPTQSLLQRWLREEKGLHIGIDYNHPNKSWTPTIIRMCCIPTRDTPYRLDLPSSSSYEVALEKALIYALNMLPSRETSK